jgi:hypothetical protein
MLGALAKKSVGETNTERLLMGLELLCKRHNVEIPA